jgi:signal peptidase I
VRHGQGKEAVSEAGLPLRTGFRDASIVLRQDRLRYSHMPDKPEDFLTIGNAPSRPFATGADRSALAVECLRRTGSLRLRVYGESMLPAVWPGDVVEIKRCSLEDLRPGQIVLAWREGRLFLHRLLAPVTSSGFLLQGDSLPEPDPWFPPQAVLGRLVACAAANRGRRRLYSPGLSRACGRLLCHFAPARRIALRLQRWTAAPESGDSASRVVRGLP